MKMATSILMPKYGLQQDEGKVIQWLKSEGEYVEKGEVLLEVESDKAVFEYKSPEAGYLRKIVVEAGSAVPVLSVVALLTNTPDEPFDEPAPHTAAGSTADQLPAETNFTSTAHSTAVASGGARVKSSPAARKLSRELGVDLASVEPTGPGGRITREDVEQAAVSNQASAKDVAPTAQSTPLSRMRQAIGRAMSESKRTVPHFYLSVEVDMTEAETWRKAVSEQRNIRLSVTDLLMKAAADSLTRFPTLNSSLESKGRMIFHPAVNIGLAVGSNDGLLVPVISDAHEKSLSSLAHEREEVVEHARNGRLRAGRPATFTISNLGMYGVSSFVAIINPPESAAMAVGAILPQVRPVEDSQDVAVRQVMQVTLSADHRLADGVLAARFLADMKTSLQSVTRLEKWL